MEFKFKLIKICLTIKHCIKMDKVEKIKDEIKKKKLLADKQKTIHISLQEVMHMRNY